MATFARLNDRAAADKAAATCNSYDRVRSGVSFDSVATYGAVRQSDFHSGVLRYVTAVTDSIQQVCDSDNLTLHDVGVQTDITTRASTVEQQHKLSKRWQQYYGVSQVKEQCLNHQCTDDYRQTFESHADCYQWIVPHRIQQQSQQYVEAIQQQHLTGQLQVLNNHVWQQQSHAAVSTGQSRQVNANVVLLGGQQCQMGGA